MLEIKFRKMVTAPLLLSGAVLFAGCQKAPELLTPQQANAQADSMVAVQNQLLREQADTDLDRRRSIEVKPLTDSFLRKPAPKTQP